MEQPLKGDSTKTKNDGTHNAVKKVVPRKHPVIKQTKTSMYRIAKSNPLLVFKDNTTENEIDDFGLSNIKLPKSILQPTTRSISDNDKLAVNTKQSNFTVKSSVVKNSVNKNGQKSAPVSQNTSLKMNKEKSTNSYNVQLRRTKSVRVQPSTSKCEPRYIYQHHKTSNLAPASKTSNNNNEPSTGSNLKPLNADKKVVKTEKRRSLSAEHFERKKGISKTETVSLMNTGESTQLLNDIGKKNTQLSTIISPIIEEVRTVTFKTPIAHKRRSISLTSITPIPFHQRFASTPGPAANDLQRRLVEWLSNKQKPVDSYKHLKCFGFHRSSRDNCTKLEENKENVEVHLTKSTSYEDLRIPENPNIATASRNANSYADNRTIAQDALTDLHTLILDGYPHEQCEAWLGMIRRKYRDLDEEPQYWECRAAIEQTRGNITSAVDCLRTAIVQGAEVKVVEYSLDQLLQKFSLLNISPSNRDKDDTNRKDRARIVLDARSVFKSSIIQFAVQERTLKKKQMQEETTSEKKFIATPVRRSTRQSRSGYTATPGVKLCASLHELDENISNSLDFHGNTALLEKLYFE